MYVHHCSSCEGSIHKGLDLLKVVGIEVLEVSMCGNEIGEIIEEDIKVL